MKMKKQGFSGATRMIPILWFSGSAATSTQNRDASRVDIANTSMRTWKTQGFTGGAHELAEQHNAAGHGFTQTSLDAGYSILAGSSTSTSTTSYSMFRVGPILLSTSSSSHPITETGLASATQCGSAASGERHSMLLQAIGNQLLNAGCTVLACDTPGYPISLFLLRFSGSSQCEVYSTQ